MGKEERRKPARYRSKFNGALYLYNTKSGSRISNSLDCRVFNLSRMGAGIMTNRIFVDNQHFFFDALGSEEVFLGLEVSVASDPGQSTTIVLEGQPVWFDRIPDEELTPFQMGVEFSRKIPSEQWGLIKKYGLDLA
ncbi:MAG: hypothetical protein ABFS19_07420 [Thermodesulfobacteriota bacterium]